MGTTQENLTKEQKIGAKRLLKLADFLDTVPRRAFNFRSITRVKHKHIKRYGFASFEDVSEEDLRANVKSHSYKECETTACALGYCSVIPSFRRLGLRLVDGDVVLAGDDTLANFGVARMIFSISSDEAMLLFNPGDMACEYVEDKYLNDRIHPLPGTATAKQVANNIRKFVKLYRS